jgi:acyl carrier protein
MTRSAFKIALEEILAAPPGSLKDSDSRETVETWSSIADVQILTSISSEFGLEPDAQLLEAETVGDLLEILDSRNAFSS